MINLLRKIKREKSSETHRFRDFNSFKVTFERSSNAESPASLFLLRNHVGECDDGLFPVAMLRKHRTSYKPEFSNKFHQPQLLEAQSISF